MPSRKMKGRQGLEGVQPRGGQWHNSMAKMTSLSQYPADDKAAQEVILHSSTSVSLTMTTLFVHLEEVQHRGQQNMSLLVPMTLPMCCRDVSLGMAAEAACHDIENDHIHLPGGTQPTFLVASRNGYAQHNPETRLPAGFVASAMNLVNDKSTDATLLTPACRMFSKMAKTNDVRARPLLTHDMDGMREVIEKKCSKVGTFRGIELDSENPSMGSLQGLLSCCSCCSAWWTMAQQCRMFTTVCQRATPRLPHVSRAVMHAANSICS
jgi:hypothetical protein